MDIHINKTVAGLMLAALLVGGVVGGTIGFVAGGHEGNDRYEMKGDNENSQYDNHADGETNDDNGNVPITSINVNGTSTVPK